MKVIKNIVILCSPHDYPSELNTRITKMSNRLIGEHVLSVVTLESVELQWVGDQIAFSEAMKNHYVSLVFTVTPERHG